MPYLAEDYDAGTFVTENCPFYVLPPEVEGETVQCGYLIVLENRQVADSPNIQLAVMIIYSKNPNPDPVVYLEGGPGGSAMSAYDFWYKSSFRASYDIILIDQRGTGFSLPSLNCAEAGDPDNQDDLENYLDSLSDDDYNAIQDAVLGVIDDDSEGMFNSVECSEEIPFDSMAAFDKLSQDVPKEIVSEEAASVESTMADCETWAVSPMGAIENEPVRTDIPVLVLSGSFDPITPQEWGAVTVQTLSNGYNFVFPGMGHGVIDSNPCPTQIGLTFLANPMTASDTSCIDMMKPVFNTDY